MHHTHTGFDKIGREERTAEGKGGSTPPTREETERITRSGPLYDNVYVCASINS